MVVRGKQRLCAAARRVGNIFKHSPCYAQPVKRACAAAYFVQYKQAAAGSIIQYACNLAHFNHKRALPARKIIRCSYAGKYSVHYGYCGLFCRHERAYVCHQRYYSNLP